MKTAMFGAGCFWGVESDFARKPGVLATEVGYSGGYAANPIYEEVCLGVTGHAEVVKIRFDPEQMTYPELLEHFWKIHDPTQLNRQGPDVGAQYRSAIYVYSEEQYQQALSSKKRLESSGELRAPVMTEISRAKEFYRAEEYHQRYLEKRDLAVCYH